jgi:hypothetical protein
LTPSCITKTVILHFDKQSKDDTDFKKQLTRAHENIVEMSGAYALLAEPFDLKFFKGQLDKRMGLLKSGLDETTLQKDYHRIVENYAMLFAGYNILAKSLGLTSDFRKKTKKILLEYLVLSIKKTVALSEQVSHGKAPWTTVDQIGQIITMVNNLTSRQGAARLLQNATHTTIAGELFTQEGTKEAFEARNVFYNVRKIQINDLFSLSGKIMWATYLTKISE